MELKSAIPSEISAVSGLRVPGSLTKTAMLTKPTSRSRGSPFEGAYEHSYTFATKPKANGLRNSDTWNLKPGRLFYLTLRETACKWGYEDEMGEGDDVERRKKLEKQPTALVKPDFQATFTAE